MILITRPLAQTANLKMLLEASDIEYAFFPTFEVKKISKPAQNIKNKEGRAAASNKSCDPYAYAFVAKVSKLNGLKINVIGSSFIISIAIKIPINKILFFK